MTTSLRKAASSAALGFSMLTYAGSSLQAQAAQTAPVAQHHSKLKGALVGAAAGHVLGGHAKAGAVAGALVQHHRNKKAAAARR